MLQIFHDSQNFFLLKELEKSGPKKRSRHRRLKKVFRSRRHSPMRGTRGAWRMGRQGRHRSSSKTRRRRRSIEEPPGVAERVKAIRRHQMRNFDDPSPSNHEADPNPKSSETCCSTLLQNQNFPNPRSSLSLSDGLEGVAVIYNPTIQEYRKLPSPQNFRSTREVLGLGYDASIDDYKVVRVPSNYYRLKVTGHKPHVEVLELKTNFWRKIPDEDTPPTRRTRPEMERSTPVRKPHTPTADLLTWSETSLVFISSQCSGPPLLHQPRRRRYL
ncbi:hypothetical protein C1H46_008301 [Malus baccata]|uniref:Uncharacterized protein n=1 Tax=Malus baccata TaxID=106549 RepID=A0A540N4X8_MALBA|nr:hypothetical protein C1H46_008301 [Malus baccata]